MIIRKLRLQRSWSQEHLASLTGLSTRTIQRIESGDNPSLESIRVLADAFEIESSLIQNEITNGTKNLKSFYSHLLKFFLVVIFLLAINFFTSSNYLWAKWVILGWGIGIVVHTLKTFDIVNFLGPEWEKRQVEKRLG